MTNESSGRNEGQLDTTLNFYGMPRCVADCLQDVGQCCVEDVRNGPLVELGIPYPTRDGVAYVMFDFRDEAPDCARVDGWADMAREVHAQYDVEEEYVFGLDEHGRLPAQFADVDDLKAELAQVRDVALAGLCDRLDDMAARLRRRNAKVRAR